ncbi:chromosome segregation protein SMC [gamma proteobacterium HTCC5015]|nr:chromosome segregation protein SMC [gamma proteobacterium HTCC5015]
MRLSKIKLAGFKSFVDPTTIAFPTNLTGIIGPNGCGKSNTIDAVRWVMGESSAKHLRGASMEDVIFKGSSARPPVGKAFVELVFDNSDGSLGGQYSQFSEISTRREVTREGKSTYYLNGTKCRRRDITDIFLGTGLGPRSYAIIEQGMISRLIEAKPEEMRVYIEEAAGISKYKERRRETENRIRHTRDNLARLDDLLDEINKQIGRLDRQAKTAERYKGMKEEERTRKAELLALKWRELNNLVNNRERYLQELQNQVEAEIAKQREVEAKIESQREGQVQANEKLGEVQGEWYRIGSEITRTEQSIRHHKDTRERQSQDLQQIENAYQQAMRAIEEDRARLSELDRDLEEKSPAYEGIKEAAELSAQRLEECEVAMNQWRDEFDAFNVRYTEASQVAKVEGTRRDQIERNQLDLQRRIERLEGELQELGGLDLDADIARAEEQEAQLAEQSAEMEERLAQIKQRQSTRREQNDDLTKQLDEATQQLQSARGRLASLEALQQAALGKHNESVVEWLKGNQLDDKPRLGEQIDVDSGWERAVETVLGNHLEAVCVDGLDAVTSVLGGLEQGEVVLMDSSSAAGQGSAEADQLLAKVRSERDIASLLNGVYAVDTLDQALAKRSSLSSGESIVTKDGLWLGRSWLRVARDQDAEGGVLSRERDIRELQEQLVELEAKVESIDEERTEGRQEVAQYDSEREALGGDLQQVHRQHADLRGELNGLRMRAEQAGKRRQNLSDERAELKAKLEEENANLTEVQEALAQAKIELGGSEEKRETLLAQREQLQDNLNDARHTAQRDREALQQLAISIESMRTAKDSADRNLERMNSQTEHLKQRREELLENLSQDDAPVEAMQAELEEWLAKRVEVEGQVEQARRDAETIEHSLRELDQERLTFERAAQEKRSQLESERLGAQENKVRCQTVKEQLDETGHDARTLLESLPEDAAIKAWEEQVQQIAQRISRLGPINLAAIDEYKETAERKEYMDAQYKDLTEALTTLENAIAKIDKETRQRFKETFDQVNKRVGEMFPKLFGGGQCHLELTGDDLLDTGVSIMARPPGKRISNIHLLSGGEKALTAVAMVFAIFELNPAPFCMLDEVDAPLDEANVGRFCRMVEEMSKSVQFIFITHNKTTMELANQLSGVTMREAGVSRLVAVNVEEAVKMADA